jgi:hydrogenase maturation protease
VGQPAELKIAVLGLGNVLMKDDALGPYAVRLLEAAHAFPDGVTVQDLGTPGLDLHPYVRGQDALIFVDTVNATGKPGELRLYRRDDILKHPPQSRVSPHDPGVKEVLLSLEFASGGPSEVLLVGVIPEIVDAGVGLSPSVHAALPAVEAAVLAELERLGRAATALEAPGEPDLWWEKSDLPDDGSSR